MKDEEREEIWVHKEEEKQRIKKKNVGQEREKEVCELR